MQEEIAENKDLNNKRQGNREKEDEFGVNGKIQKLNFIKIKNFKSFNSSDEEENVIVGPFSYLNSIVGPNGTGKSNIIDALCFLFGVSLQSTRSLALKSLINNNVITPNKEAYVILNVNIVRKQKNDNGEDTFVTNLLEFKRQIKIDENETDKNKSVTQFYVNNQEYNREDYTDLLESYKIIPEAKNFLLMQGETDSITNLDPLSLTTYFEKLSGSYKYKNDYDQSQKNLKIIQEEIVKKTQKMSQLKHDRKKMKQVRSKNDEYQKLIAQIEEIEKKVFLFEILKLDNQLEFTSKQLTGLENSKDNNQKQREDTRRQLQNLEVEISKKRKDLTEVQKQLDDLVSQKGQGLQNLSTWESDLRYKQGLLPTYQKSFEEAEKNKLQYQPIQEDLERKMQEISQNIEELENQQQNQMNENMDPVKRQKYEKCLEKSRDQNYRYNQEISRISNELPTLQSEIDILNENIQNQEKSQKDQQNLIEDYNNKINQKIKESKQLLILQEECQIKINDMEEQKIKQESNQQQARYLSSYNEQLKNQIDILQNHLKEDQDTDKIVFDLQQSVRGCHGTFGSNLQLHSNSRTYEKPLKQALGRVLNFIVVENTEAAIQCKKILNLKNCSKEFINLDKIPNFTSTLNKMEKLQKDNKSLQINIPLKKITSVRSQIESKIKKCLEFFLHKKIFVQNYTKASHLQKMNLDYIKEIIGIEDNSVINVQDGMIKTVAENSTFDIYKFGNAANYDKQQEFEKKRKEILAQIQNNTDQIQKLKEDQEGQQYNQVINQKFEIDQKINSIKQDISSMQAKVVQLNNQKINGDTQNLKINLEKKKKAIEEYTSELKTHTEQLKNIDKKIFQEFCEEYNISDINEFKEKDLAQIELLHIQIQQKNHVKNNIQNQLDDSKLEKYTKEAEKFEKNIKFTEEVIKQLIKKIDDVKQNTTDFSSVKDEIQQKIKKKTKEIENKEEEKRQLAKAMQEQRSGNYQHKIKSEQLKTQISSIFQQKLNKIEQAETEGVQLEFIEEEIKKQKSQNLMAEENDEKDDDISDSEKNISKSKRKNLDYIDSQKMYEYFDDNQISQEIFRSKEFENKKMLYQDIDKALKQVKEFKQDYGLYHQSAKNSKKNKMQLEDEEEEEDDDQIHEIKEKKEEVEYNSKIQDQMDACLEKIEDWIKSQIHELNEKYEEKQVEIEEYHSKTMNDGILGDNDAYEKLEKQIQNLEKDLKEKNSEKTTAKNKFNEIKNLRYQAFNQLYEKVKERINNNYKRINEGDKKNRIHCSAEIYLSDKDEPYNGELIYNPVPPGKLVVSDIESQLSGGEKTMATLALFFTVNEVIGTPFLILDETDAFLDFQNTKNYVKYLRNVTRKNNKQYCQCFVISHKKQVYDSSENFIGVTLNREQSSTQIFSYQNK